MRSESCDVYLVYTSNVDFLILIRSLKLFLVIASYDQICICMFAQFDGTNAWPNLGLGVSG